MQRKAGAGRQAVPRNPVDHAAVRDQDVEGGPADGGQPEAAGQPGLPAHARHLALGDLFDARADLARSGCAAAVSARADRTNAPSRQPISIFMVFITSSDRKSVV